MLPTLVRKFGVRRYHYTPICHFCWKYHSDLTRMSAKRRVCIIGAGTAGLCALKHCLDEGMEATAYEQSEGIGGTWVYSEDTENAPYAAVHEVHSSMYEGLRTNLPKEVMGFPEFSFPEGMEQSYIDSFEVVKFLQSYAAHFKLAPHIKLLHAIIRVRPRKGEWEVYFWDIKTDNYEVAYFDYVFVCNGHYTTPLYPEIEGMAVYQGRQLHSHLYRKADMLKDAKVLIIGGSASGIDITYQIHKSAAHVYLSHHMTTPPNVGFMANVTQKPDVEQFTESGAVFKDGSSETFDFVIYCTGYKFTFPFLSADSGINVDDNFVQPLYKHCININYPTMVFIGLPFRVCPSHLCDLQVRFALKYYTDQLQLPDRRQMLEDTENDMQERWASGLRKRQAHEMANRQFNYYKDLAETAGIDPIKPVVIKLMICCSRKYIIELETFRNIYFKVIDDENFIQYTKE